MDDDIKYDECSTDAHHSLKQCHVVLEKVDLDNDTPKRKKSRKKCKLTVEQLKWRRSVIMKKSKMRGYIHTPEEYERLNAYARMRYKNFTPSQRERKKARNAIFREKAREKERLRIQSLNPEEFEQEFNRKKPKAKRKPEENAARRVGIMSEEKREAKNTARRLQYHNRKLTVEERERINLLRRERRKAGRMLKNRTAEEIEEKTSLGFESIALS